MAVTATRSLLGGGPTAHYAEPPMPRPAVTLLADGSVEAAHLEPRKSKPPFSRKRLAFRESSGFGGGSGGGALTS